MKLFTEIDFPSAAGTSPFRLSLSDGVAVFGSCFADEMGGRMRSAGFSVLQNPLGTLYNPASTASCIARLDGESLFCESDCVRMGAGMELFCSFEHHSRFARESREEFLKEANNTLLESRRVWKGCNKVIITLGTAFVWKHGGERVVSNCLKLPSSEFTHEMLSVEEVSALLQGIVGAHQEKEFLFTVSPIRHLNPDGAHANTLSKATLHLGLERALRLHPERCFYFPAYELLTDELRDYRFYASDLVHPSEVALEYIWQKFAEQHISPKDANTLKLNEKENRRARHRALRQGKNKNG